MHTSTVSSRTGSTSTCSRSTARASALRPSRPQVPRAAVDGWGIATESPARCGKTVHSHLRRRPQSGSIAEPSSARPSLAPSSPSVRARGSRCWHPRRMAPDRKNGNLADLRGSDSEAFVSVVEPAHLPDLVESLERADCLVERLGEGAVRIVVPGAPADEAALELRFFLAAWRASRSLSGPKSWSPPLRDEVFDAVAHTASAPSLHRHT